MPSEPLTPAELAVYPEPQDVEYPISPHDFFTQLLLTHFCPFEHWLLDVQQPDTATQVWLLAVWHVPQDTATQRLFEQR